MHYISHRGNIEGPNPNRENDPSYIREAIRRGYEVEIDVWRKNGSFYLGHDRAQYRVDFKFLQNKRLWCHAKNIEALSELLKHRKRIHCFWHEEDNYAITSKGYIWAYPGNIDGNTIVVMPEKYNLNPSRSARGVCSDYIKEYKSPRRD
jgi:hypothetical protein